MNKRFDIFDLMRALACFGVLIGHWFCFYSHYVRSFFPFKVHIIGVGLFFFISGYLIPISLNRQKENINIFFKQRFFRLIPSILIIGILCGVLLKLFPHKIKHFLWAVTFSGDLFDIKDVLGMPMWTLHVEFKFYILLTISFIIANKEFNIKFIKIFYFSLLILILFSILWSCIFNTSFDFAGLTYNSISVLFVFLGTLFYMLQNNFLNKKVFLRLFIITIITGVMLTAYSEVFYKNKTLINYLHSFINSINFMFGVLIGIYFTLKFINCKVNRFIILLADISYPLYLCHFNLLLKYKYSGFFIAIIISYVVHIIIEKPFIRYSKDNISLIKIYKNLFSSVKV